MIYFASQNKAESEFFKQVTSSNEKYRSNKDWLKMKGRAISED